MSEIGEALRARGVTGALFMELDLPSAPVRAFSGIGSYTDPEGRTFTGTGGLGRISPVQTSEGVSASAFTISLDVSRGANEERFADLAAAMLADRQRLGPNGADHVKGRRLRAWIGVFHPRTGALIGGALRQWASGVGSHISVSWSPEGLSMTLHCEPLIGSAWPAKGRYLTHEDQQLLHPGDLGLEFITIIANGGRNVVWNPGT